MDRETVKEWVEKYERAFGRPYPPALMSDEEFVEDAQRRIRENDPLPPELNNPMLVF
ncbi:hypothetical protein [Adlercreutzia muris]|uniref:hypothetical protein n=1 Tax=Adlercreutzia muris TaxID=1796610 RepID=UPI003510D854